MLVPRRNPISVMPCSSASSTASDDGADTAASTGMPAIAAFWTSSNDARPDTISTVPPSGTRPSNSAQPVALSTALCRPTSSRTTSSSPAAVKMPAACRPPVDSKTRCRSRSRSGKVTSVSGATRHASPAGENRVFSLTASSAALPQTPQDDVV
jgi:hypothetical protein